MKLHIEKAVKEKLKLKLALEGPPGSGKTFSSLAIGARLAQREGKRLLVIDTEKGRASLYADKFDFDRTVPDSYNPKWLTSAIQQVASMDEYGAIVVDSFTHFWSGKDGMLEQADRRKGRSKFGGWGEVRPMERALIDTMLYSDVHLLVTMRTKNEYEEVQENGKTKFRRVGLQADQRKDIDYEFDVVGKMTQASMYVEKTRCEDIFEETFDKPGADFADQLYDWVNAGEKAPPRPLAIEAASEAAPPTTTIAPPAHRLVPHFDRVKVRSHLERTCRKYAAEYRDMEPGPEHDAVKRAIVGAARRADVEFDQVKQWLEEGPAKPSNEDNEGKTAEVA